MTTNQTLDTDEGVRRSDGLLRTVLKLDAFASGAVGVLLLAASPVLDRLLGTPVMFHIPVGIFLIAYAAVVFVLATRPEISRAAAGTVVVFNLAWAIASLSVVIAGVFPLTVLSTVFVLFQGAVVALFAILQTYALRRKRV